MFPAGVRTNERKENEMNLTKETRFDAGRGNCYQVALEMLRLHGPDATARLCHGIPTLRKAPFCRFGHAWVERIIFDVVVVFDPLYPGEPIPTDFYYERGNINPAEVVRYELHEANTKAKRTGHSGPWDEWILKASHRNADTGEIKPDETSKVTTEYNADHDGHFNRGGHELEAMTAEQIKRNRPECEEHDGDAPG